jgi:Cofactor assembly of complex C subunit B, CCB2/CCB4
MMNKPLLLPRLFLSKNEDDTTAQKSAKVRFSSYSTSAADYNANPVDATLSWITSDIGSIALGGVGLVLLLVGRLVLDVSTVSDDTISATAMGMQTRVNLLAVFAVGAVLLNGLSQLDVQSVLAEQVDLIGSLVADPVITKKNVFNEQQLSWVLSSITAATPADTAVLLVSADETWEPVAYMGVVPPNLLTNDPKSPKQTPILDRFLKVPSSTVSGSVRRESYLPTLQALPGRIEFTNFVLPSNTQAALLLPLMISDQQQAVLLLGSNQARSFTPRDIAWSQTVVTRLEQ